MAAVIDPFQTICQQMFPTEPLCVPLKQAFNAIGKNIE